jgi:hypothetical protein
MPLCDILLRCAEEPALYRPFWSDETFVELRRTLLKFGMTPEKTSYRIRTMQQESSEATIIVPQRLVKAIADLPDLSDCHVVAAAILARVDVIVTGNLKHFPKAALDPYYLHAQSPDQFLLHQYHLNPGVMLEKLDNQANAIGQARAAIVERLKVSAPLFANAVTDRQCR